MAYERVNWENLLSTKTPVNADNLNKMDEGIKDLETELSKKANSNDVYTKTETDTRLNKMDEGIANIDTKINSKANSADVYNKTDIDKKMNALDSNKINSSYLTDFADGIARKVRVSNVDFNSLATYQSGLITILNATANAPVNRHNSHWYVLQIYTKEDGKYEYITQIATYFFEDDDPNIYIRKCINGTWGAWRKIATSAV